MTDQLTEAEAVVRAAIDMLPAYNGWREIASLREEWQIKRLVDALRAYRVLHPYTGPGTAWEVELAAEKEVTVPLTVPADAFVEAFNLLYSVQWLGVDDGQSAKTLDRKWKERVYEFIEKHEDMARALQS